MLPIIKLEYRHYFFNISNEKSELKTTTSITNDGIISTKFHSLEDGKIIAEVKRNYPTEEFEKLPHPRS